MDKPQATPAARGLMRLPLRLALDHAERNRPGITSIYEELRKTHPHHNWRLVVMKAKEQWDASKKCTGCGKPLTADEVHYYGATCNTCEGNASYE